MKMKAFKSYLKLKKCLSVQDISLDHDSDQLKDPE